MVELNMVQFSPVSGLKGTAGGSEKVKGIVSFILFWTSVKWSLAEKKKLQKEILLRQKDRKGRT